MNYIKEHKKYFFCIVLVVSIIASFTGCRTKTNQKDETKPKPSIGATTEPISKSSFKLNTIITITLYDSQDENIINECFELCDAYENQLSRTKTSSEIYQLNESSGQPMKLSEDTLSLLKRGLYYSELSNGAFDLSVEPITSLWNFGSDKQRLPKEEEIKEALTHVGYENIELTDNTVTLKEEGMGIDLGAIAKGYIADKIKELLLARGVNSAIINLGGNVLCVGAKPSGEPFKIGIQKPYEDRSETIAVMEISDKSVVSSGIYERFFVEDGVNYHHILNPLTGYPYDNELLSVTIISDASVDGDALSTTCFALGLEKGLELINSLENTYAAFITKDGILHYSDDFLDHIPVSETN